MSHEGSSIMNNRYALMFGVAVAISYMPPCLAGPCTRQIDEMQGRIDAKLEAAAAAGPTGQETTSATMHRQPTPQSIAKAEAKLGDISPETIQAIEDSMDRARKADLAGDGSGCEKALAEVKKALGK
jgi:hypothetical protein